MNKQRLRYLVEKLQTICCELEAELKSDPDSYVNPNINLDYDEVVSYYANDNDDDEEGL